MNDGWRSAGGSWPRSAGGGEGAPTPCATIPPAARPVFGGWRPASSAAERNDEERLMTRTPTRTSGRDSRGRPVGRLPARCSGCRDPGRMGPSARGRGREAGRGRATRGPSRGARSSWAGARRGVAGARRRSARRRADACAGEEEGSAAEAAGHGGHRRGGTRGPVRRADASRRRRCRHRVRGRRPGRRPGPLERDGLLAGRPDQRVVRGAHQLRPSDDPPACPALRAPDRGPPCRPGARLGGRLPRARRTLSGRRRRSRVPGGVSAPPAGPRRGGRRDDPQDPDAGGDQRSTA